MMMTIWLFFHLLKWFFRVMIIVVILFLVYFSLFFCDFGWSDILWYLLFLLLISEYVLSEMRPVTMDAEKNESRPPHLRWTTISFSPGFCSLLLLLLLFSRKTFNSQQSIFEHYGRCHMIATCEIKFYYLLLLFLLFVRHFTPQKRMSNVCICCFWI